MFRSPNKIGHHFTLKQTRPNVFVEWLASILRKAPKQDELSPNFCCASATLVPWSFGLFWFQGSAQHLTEFDLSVNTQNGGFSLLVNRRCFLTSLQGLYVLLSLKGKVFLQDDGSSVFCCAQFSAIPNSFRFIGRQVSGSFTALSFLASADAWLFD